MHSDPDADMDIVSSDITVANTFPVTLFGDDTDLLIILLLWHFNPSLHHPVHLYSNSSKTTVDIKKSKQLLSDKLTHLNLTVHTFLGCDITSRLRSIVLHILLQKCFRNQEFWNLLNVFSLASDREDILQAGEKILLLLLGGKRAKILDELRVYRYHKKMQIHIQHSVKVEARGPTSDVSQQHVLWIYHQIQEWRGDYPLDPL